MRTSARRGRRTAGERFDPTPLRDIFLNEMPTVNKLARVVSPSQGADPTDHFSLERNEAGQLVDILLVLETVPDRKPAVARMTTSVGSTVAGTFWIPPVGTEMVCVFQEGDEVYPIAIAVLSSARFPEAAAQANGTYVICGPAIVLTDSDGGGELEAARKTDAVSIPAQGVGNLQSILDKRYMLLASPVLLTDPPATISGGSSIVKIK